MRVEVFAWKTEQTLDVGLANGNRKGIGEKVYVCIG